MNKHFVVLMETEDGIISKPNKEYVEGDFSDCDTLVFKSEINDLVETEMDESCHDDGIEDYDSQEEFYLSNATKDSYVDYVIDRMDDTRISQSLALEVQEMVIEEIKNRCR
ncbi:MAG: hypothetical protein ACRDD7_04700 [Peptostreptococcaceae bacterium]